MATRITGLTSGLDTEALVSAMVSSYQSKVTKNQQAQQSLQYKLDALKNVNTDVYSLFSATDKMRWSSAYSLKTTTVSDTTKAKVTAADNAVNGTQTLKIIDLAQAGYLTGGTVKSDSALSTSSKLSDIYTTSGTTKNEYAGGSITVTVGGKEKTISLGADTTAQNLVNSLKDAGLNASFDSTNGRFFISSKSSGADNDFKLVANDANGLQSLKALGLYSADKDTMAEYKKWSDREADYGTDKWDTFVTEQYESKKISYASRAASNASQYNSAVANLEYYEKEKNKLLDTFNDADGNRTINSVGEARAKADTLAGVRDGNADYSAYAKKNAETGDIEIDERGYIIYDTDAMKAADEELYKKFKAETDEIQKYTSAEDKLKDFDTKIADNQTKITELSGKVRLETDDAGKTTAKALTESDAEWAALVTEVDKDNSDAKAKLDDALWARVQESRDMLAGMNANEASEGAVRIAGSNAKIELNGAEFISSSNSFSINGLSIEATAITNGAITITTATDTQGIYDKIKDFLQQYNDVINKINKLYNADSAKGYDPLTEDQKSSMSETEINKWETKIKDSILRRNDTLSGIISSMTNAMAKSFNIGGKSYSLATFGVKTLGYFASQKNENYAFHIDGDADDTATSGNADKLMAAITSDPESVVSFFQKLSSSLYDSLNAKMKSSTLSSAYTIYNDKQMASEYSNYTSVISKWQDKVAAQEDYYYKKFASMEKTLSSLQSQTSSMSSFFGG